MFDDSMKSAFRTLNDSRLAALGVMTANEIKMLSDVPLTRETLSAGDHISSVNEANGTCYLLNEGFACRLKITFSGSRRVTGLLLPGDVFGQEQPRTRERDVQFYMLTAGTVFSFSREHIQTLANNYSGISRAVNLCNLAENTILTEAALSLGRLSERERLVNSLHSMCLDLHSKLENGGGGFELGFKEDYIIDALGLTLI